MVGGGRGHTSWVLSQHVLKPCLCSLNVIESSRCVLLWLCEQHLAFTLVVAHGLTYQLSSYLHYHT